MLFYLCAANGAVPPGTVATVSESSPPVARGTSRTTFERREWGRLKGMVNGAHVAEVAYSIQGADKPGSMREVGESFVFAVFPPTHPHRVA